MLNSLVMDPNAGKKKLMNRLGKEEAIASLHAEDFEEEQLLSTDT